MKEDNNPDTKKRTTSLERMIFFGSFFFAILISIVVLAVGILQFLNRTFTDSKREIRHELNYLFDDMNMYDVEALFRGTKELYEPVADRYSQESCYPGGIDKEGMRKYRGVFEPLMDERYKKVQNTLRQFREDSELNDIALFFYDEERGRMVIVVDGDLENRCFSPGQWMGANTLNAPSKRVIDEICASPKKVKLQSKINGGWTLLDFQPVVNRSGVKIGYAAMYLGVSDVVSSFEQFIAMAVPLILFLVGVFDFIILWKLHTTAVEPLVTLVGAAKDYSKLSAEEIEDGRHIFENLPLHASSELMDLLAEMQRMEKTVTGNMREIKEITASKERVEADLSLARNIQMSMLPVLTDEIEAEEAFDIYGLMRPARQVGGDFYDFFLLDPTHLVFLVADVSGKGAGAAMFMAISRTMIRTRMQSGGSPAEVLADVDGFLNETNGENMFVTVWLGVLDLENGHIILCNAGHEHPAVCHSREGGGEGVYEMPDEAHGMALAFWPGAEFIEDEINLNPGDRIVLFTDGVSEANVTEDNLFGEERILSVLNDRRDESVRDLAERLLEAVDDFTRGAEQFDDITILALQYNGKDMI